MLEVITGVNDLATTHPDLVKEWDYEKNDLKPTDVTAGSAKKVWWKCQNGHSWQASVVNRAKGTGCPFCSGKNTKNFTFYLNEAVVSELSEVSQEIGFSQSKAVERAIKLYIKRYKETGDI